MATIPPAEILEASYPVLFRQWALRPDSAGAGKHRGGLGAIYDIETLSPGGADVFLLGERGRFAPFGVNGGETAALNRFVWQEDGVERSPALASKVTGVKLTCGGHVRLETPGGGGWGIAADRDPVIVARDVRLGYVSPEKAFQDYRVVVSSAGVLDSSATQRLREGDRS
jgi:N-methylhydantoinase B